MLAEATVVPRTVLDLGLGVDVQEGALLVAALPCREDQTCVHLGELDPDPPVLLLWPGPRYSKEGQVGLVSSPGPASPETQGMVSQSLSNLTRTWAVTVLPSQMSMLP